MVSFHNSSFEFDAPEVDQHLRMVEAFKTAQKCWSVVIMTLAGWNMKKYWKPSNSVGELRLLCGEISNQALVVGGSHQFCV